MSQDKPGPNTPGSDKVGPVKPPVLDMTARSKSGGSSSTAAPEAPRTHASNGNAGSVLALGIVGGGVLGLAAAYALAWAGLWPAREAAGPDPRVAAMIESQPLLAERAARVPELEAEIARLDEALATLSASDETLSAQLADISSSQTELAAALESGGDGAPVDGTALADLESRLAALESAPPADGAAPAPANGEALDALEAQVADLTDRLDGQQAVTADLEAAIATALAASDQPGDIGGAVQIPLILAGLDSAFAAGRPYLSELDALSRTLPDLEVAEPVREAAGTGLPRDGIVRTAFADQLPAILAARPVDAEGDWQQSTADWFRSVLALRPSGEIEGDDPQAVLSRLEAAVERGDFLTAGDLFGQLPEEMRQSAAEVGDMIILRADAARLVEDVRRNALNLTTEAAS
jgi:hypothetical protein